MFRKIFYLILFVLVTGIVVSPFFILGSTPLIRETLNFNATEIDRAKSLLKRNDPRRLPPGTIVTQWIDQDEISLIAGYMLTQLGGGGVAVEFHPGRAIIQGTIPIPDNLIGNYLNFSVILGQWSNSLSVESLILGDIAIPGWIAEPVRDYANRALQQIPEYKAALEALNGMQILEDRMLVIFQWRPELVDRLKSRGQNLIVSDEEKQRLLAYSKQIAAVSSNPQLPDTVSLSAFLTPLFFLAEARGGDPVEENRAAILALSFYFSGVDIARMVGVDLPQQNRVSKRLTLSGRYDFAQHFLSSAALTLTGGAGLADTIGLFKELDDAKGGSGFSFTDLGADRSGVRMAEFATANAASARSLQTFLTGQFSEEDFIPDFLDLPEFLPNERFEREYGGVGGAGYNELLADIEGRLDRCRLYQ